ncbi:MAG: hypothetical protein LBN98_04795 [Prevotellaceae bacterium]|nr:hypothetical protein [Prevotellaceae bacterium]
MKKVFTLMVAAAMVFAGCDKDDDSDDKKTPPYAASTQTWTFGEQTWSDAIQMPDCNKETFDDGTNEEPKADGRSYTEDGHTWYYYSWPYVDAHKATMCPSPWRVPTTEDFFELLAANAAAADLQAAWGYGGYANSTSVEYTGSYAWYWASTENGTNYAYFMNFSTSGADTGYASKYYGFQVRCVK